MFLLTFNPAWQYTGVSSTRKDIFLVAYVVLLTVLLTLLLKFRYSLCWSLLVLYDLCDGHNGMKI